MLHKYPFRSPVGFPLVFLPSALYPCTCGLSVSVLNPSASYLFTPWSHFPTGQECAFEFLYFWFSLEIARRTHVADKCQSWVLHLGLNSQFMGFDITPCSLRLCSSLSGCEQSSILSKASQPSVAGLRPKPRSACLQTWRLPLTCISRKPLSNGASHFSVSLLK